MCMTVVTGAEAGSIPLPMELGLDANALWTLSPINPQGHPSPYSNIEHIVSDLIDILPVTLLEEVIFITHTFQVKKLRLQS